MADQTIDLGFRVDTSPLGAIPVAMANVERSVDRVATATKRTGNAFGGVGLVAFQAGQAVQDFAIGLERGLGPALMYSINNLSFIANMLGAGGAFGIGLQVATTGVALLAQNWDKLNGVISATPVTTAERLVNAIGKPQGASADNAALARRAQEAVSAAASMAGQPNEADAKAAGEWSNRINVIGFDRVRAEIVRGMRAGMSTEDFLGRFGFQGATVGGATLPGSSSLEQYQAQANDPGRQDKIIREAIQQLEADIGQRLNMAGADPALQRGLIETLKTQNPELARLLMGENVPGQNAAIQEQTDAALQEKLKQRSLKIQDAMDDAQQAVLEGRKKEAQQLNERLRWERIAFEANQNVENQRLAAKKAEAERMDPRQFLDRAVDNLAGGGLNPMAVARALRMRRLMGQNDIQARVGLREQIAGDIFGAGQAGAGPIVTPMEARAQARRLIENASPEAMFFGQQLERQAAAMGPLAQQTERLAVAQERILARGVPMFLGRQRRPPN